jgi:hypothetical protein
LSWRIGWPGGWEKKASFRGSSKSLNFYLFSIFYSVFEKNAASEAYAIVLKTELFEQLLFTLTGEEELV